jgi:hypothetical protein
MAFGLLCTTPMTFGSKRDRAPDPFVAAPLDPEVVVLPPAKYIVIEGRGAPESEPFRAAIGALNVVACAIKLVAKKTGRADVKISPLEAMWWAPVVRSVEPRRRARTNWRWKAMNRVPEFVDASMVAAARQIVEARRGDHAVWKVMLETIEEGRVVQALHVGSYATEPETIARMHELMATQRLLPRGYHHEIYLRDPRRADPKTLRTILRQPVYLR